MLQISPRPFALLLLLIVSAPVSAQNSYGRITGRVTDASQAVVPHASIHAVQSSTNISATVTTNSEGVYELLNLLPGEYLLTAQAKGFKKTERGPIEVRVGDIVSIELTVQLGEVTETIHVKDEAPLIDTSSASAGQVIDQKLISEMPLPGGAVSYLMQLSPGVVSMNAPTHGWLPQAKDSIANLASGGTRGRSSEFQLDGMPNMGQGGNMGFSPPPEMIQEFRIQTSAYDAAVGRFTGAQVNMVPKSGSNAHHGTGWFSHLSRPLMTHPFFINKQLYDLTTGPPTADKRDRLWPATKTNRERFSITGPVVIPKIYDGHDVLFLRQRFHATHLQWDGEHRSPYRGRTSRRFFGPSESWRQLPDLRSGNHSPVRRRLLPATPRGQHHPRQPARSSGAKTARVLPAS